MGEAPSRRQRFLPIVPLAATLMVWAAAWAPLFAADGMTFKRTDDQREIAYKDVEDTLPTSSVVAKLAAQKELGFFGAQVTAAADSTVFLSLSSEYLMAACLVGAISAGSVSAGPGQVVVWRATSGTPAAFDFDVDRFLATTSLAIDPKTRSALERVSKAQKRLVFWGLLQPGAVNVRSPVAPDLERVRRGYLLAPTVIRLRREAGGDTAKLARLVAKRFLTGIVDGEPLEPVKSLLSPNLFQAPGQALEIESWRMLRGEFAAALARDRLPRVLAGFTIEASDDDMQWLVRTPQETYGLRLEQIDDMVFIEALEPIEESVALPAAGLSAVVAFNPQSVAAFNAETIKKFTAENPLKGELAFGLTAERRQAILDLVAVAADFRLGMAADSAEPGEAVSRKDLDFIAKALELGPDGPPPALWRSFFRGSLAYVGHALAPVKRIGFYNPVVDGWVMTNWSERDERLELVGVRAVPGEIIRGRPADGFEPPAWMKMADESELTALALGHRDSVHAFKKRYPLLAKWPPSDSAADGRKSHRPIIESRLGVIRRSLSALGRPTFFSAINDLLASIASGDPARLRSLMSGDGDTPVQWVTGLLTPVRTQFRPTGVLRRPDGVTVLFGVPRNGRWILIARYGPDDSDRPPVVQSVAFLDLLTAEDWRPER